MHCVLRIFILLILIPALFEAESLACSCVPLPIRPGVTIEMRRKEQLEYFLNEFKGAAFIGKIVERQLVGFDRDGHPDGDSPESRAYYYRYTVRVRDHWLGVNSQLIFVYGEPDEYRIGPRFWGGTSCGFKLTKGQTHFFTPEFYKNDLHINLCDFAGGGSDPKEGRVEEFTKIMGGAKRF